VVAGNEQFLVFQAWDIFYGLWFCAILLYENDERSRSAAVLTRFFPAVFVFKFQIRLNFAFIFKNIVPYMLL
jgi:hypothetical protein